MIQGRLFSLNMNSLFETYLIQIKTIYAHFWLLVSRGWRGKGVIISTFDSKGDDDTREYGTFQNVHLTRDSLGTCSSLWIELN